MVFNIPGLSFLLPNFLMKARGECGRPADIRFEQFLNGHTSYVTFLLVLLGFLLFNELVVSDVLVPSPLVETLPTSLMRYISVALRTVVCCFVALTCYIKASKVATRSGQLLQKLINALPTIQALYPLLMNLAFSFYIICDKFICTEIDRPKLHDSAVYLIIAGLKAYPMVTFMLLRDKRQIAVIASWLIGVVTHLVVAVESGSHREMVTFFAYTLTSGAILLDCYRQNRVVIDLITSLQNTLAENEEMSAEVQAQELRAMIGNVAHDLKTPLTSFLSGLECMSAIVKEWQGMRERNGDAAFLSKATESFAALEKSLKNMESTNNFMTMTINRCLDYTKASKGVKLVPRFETMSLKTALDVAVQMINDMNSSIVVNLHPWSADICSHIITDRQWFVENMLCLLSNAVKYSNRGIVDVHVRLQSNSQPSDQSPGTTQVLIVEVQDTGIGLSEESMQNLFAPFKQAQRLAGGTGLGLYSLAKRVEALRGQYGVDKRPDGKQGCLFWFAIPYRPDELVASTANSQCKGACFPDPANTAADVQASMMRMLDHGPVNKEPDTCNENIPFTDVGSADSSAEGYSVMVVDDAPLIVKMTTALLKQKGHRVTEQAVNGADALEKLLARYRDPHKCGQGNPPFDAVLMDLQMPVLDGIEAIRKLRAAEEGMRQHPAALASTSAVRTRGAAEPQPPVRRMPRRPFHQHIIALSANSDSDTQQAALDAGADVFLAKPFTHGAFMKLMNT